MSPEKDQGPEEKPPARALNSSERFRSVSLCNQRPSTSREFAHWMGISQSLASYYLRQMTKEGYLYVADVELVKGHERYRYAAQRQALLVDDEFAQMSLGQRYEITKSTLQDFSLHCEALAGLGPIGTRRGDFLVCADLDLCAEGWAGLMTALLCVFETALEIEARSQIRLRHGDTEPALITLALGGFESPTGSRDGENADFFGRFVPRSHRALESGMLDGRIDSHLTWIPMLLDGPGWDELAEALRWLQRCAYEITLRSADHLRRSGEAPIHTTFVAAGFGGPPWGLSAAA